MVAFAPEHGGADDGVGAGVYVWGYGLVVAVPGDVGGPLVGEGREGLDAWVAGETCFPGEIHTRGRGGGVARD